VRDTRRTRASAPAATPAGSPARRARIRRVTGAVAATLVASVALSGCSYQGPGSWSRLGFPMGIADNAHMVQHLWTGAWIAAMAVGVFVWGLIIYAVIAYRRRGSEMPAQTTYNMPIEALYTILPLLSVGVLFFYTARDEADETHRPAHIDHVDTVIAYRWAWTFQYNDAVDGKTVYDVGTDSQLPELWLPKGKVIQYNLLSNDVIHAFWIPAFLTKLDVIPGRENKMYRTAEMLGTYPGRCSELCGLHHSQMLFEVHVVTPAQYQQHLQHLMQIGQVGPAEGHLSPMYDPNAAFDGSSS
jgi:cytochrome c oxidase subunit 2